MKWKALLISSLVLLLIVGILSLFSEQALLRQFDQQRQALDKARVVALTGLIENATSSLQRTASLSEALAGMEAALLSQSSEMLESVFQLHWSDLVIDTGLVEARFFADDGSELAAFGQRDQSEAAAQRIRQWVNSANSDEVPVTTLFCGRACRYYAVTPLMVDARRLGVALFASPVSDIVSAFNRVTNTHIALLLRQDPHEPHQFQRSLNSWRMSIPTMTDPPRLYPVTLAAAQAFELPMLEGGAIVRQHYSRYRVRAVPLIQINGGTRGYWLLIEDVTSALSEIRQAINRTWAYGLLGLALAEGLLAFLLWKPLSRLRATAETLPLLGQGEFREAREQITNRKARRRALLSDESDVLDDTAVALTHRLEALEATVRARSGELATQAQILRQERDFIRSLLDTAQAVILTQNEVGEMLSLNAFGASLLAHRHGIKSGVGDFYQSFITGDTEHIRKALREIATNVRPTFQHNAEMTYDGEKTRDIAWRHSSISVGMGKWVVLSVGIDVTEQRQAERQIAWLADHDPLTNLFNRRRFQEELSRAIGEAGRFGERCCLLFLDLDQFKLINDSSGHAVGDSLLKAVGHVLKRIVRATDIIARLGGDEFAVLLPRSNADGGVELAEKLRGAIGQISIGTSGRSQRVTPSIGVAVYPDHGADANDLLAIADVAMYQAKAGGRDRCSLYSAKMEGRELVRGVLSTKTLVEEAIARKWLTLYFQPIVDLRTQCITHVEGLARIKLPDGGVLMPSDFISIAERVGVIRAIDEYVLRLAASQIAYFEAADVDVRLAVNQSAFAMEDLDFARSVKELMQENPTMAGRLIIEMTESAAVTNMIVAEDIMWRLKRCGCEIALDDFGTGFSSLSHLKHLPVDYVKIDGVFVRDVVDKQDNQILIRAVVELARMFGAKTIAEHVETQEAYAWLRGQRVDYAQGFFTGQAMPRDELVSRLRAEPGGSGLMAQRRATRLKI